MEDDLSDADDCADGDGAADLSASDPMGWEPDPTPDAETGLAGPTAHQPPRPRKRRRVPDIIGSLVNVFGSKEVFVREYQALLADRLLVKQDYGTDREVGTLELLKVRFGDAGLHRCEVMLKDLDASKRTNANVQQRMLRTEREREEREREERERERTSGPPFAAGADISVSVRRPSPSSPLPPPSRRSALSFADDAKLSPLAPPAASFRLPAAHPMSPASPTSPDGGTAMGFPDSPRAVAVGAVGPASALALCLSSDRLCLSSDRLEPLIVSKEFWPPLPDADSRELHSLRLPPAVRSRMDAYALQFEQAVGARELRWKPNLGQFTHTHADTHTRTHTHTRCDAMRC